jgi:hypothetical protein
MPFQITNKSYGDTTIRYDGVGTYTTPLANLGIDVTETISYANIKRLMWSTNGSIQITRNSNTICSLHNSGEMKFDEYGYAIANNNTGNIAVTIAGGGSLTMQLSKMVSDPPFATLYVTSGLQFNLQTAPTSGSTWTDTSGNSRNATLVGSPSYVSNNGGGIRLNNENTSGTDYISVPYNIASNTVTVEVVASFNPTSFWGTIWGNEIYNTNGGYLAYVDSATNIGYGIPNGEILETITDSNAIRQWIFVINGTQASLFLNGSQIGTTVTISNQTIFATGDFYFGARHLNNGTGSTDTINNSNSADYPVFYQMRVYNKALSGAEITQNYNAVKDTYGI